MVPIPTLTPIPNAGWTFNESISYDPSLQSNHYARVYSKHVVWRRGTGGWVGNTVGEYSAGDAFMRTASWRFWAGTYQFGDHRMSPIGRSPYKVVYGEQFEKLDRSLYPYYQSTDATSCQIFTW